MSRFAILDEDATPSTIPSAPRYAWVTLVMKGDDYIPGALALAQSLRNCETKSALVCMVTDDVTNTNALSTVFDQVVKVPYLEYKTRDMKMKRQNELYGGWMSVSYTKWRALDLKQYEKVMFIDADALVMKNMDFLFEMQAPAATFSSPWATNYKTTKYRDKEIKEGQMEEFTIAYPQCHNDIVPADQIMKELVGGGYTFIASLVLLEPTGSEDFKSALDQLVDQSGFGFNNYSTPDEQSLAWYYARKGTSFRYIHQIYNFIIHKPEWIGTQTPYMLHYFNKLKPWHSKTGWVDSPWNTDRIWWYTYFKWATKLGKRECKNVKLVLDPEVWSKISLQSLRIKLTGIDKKYFPWIAKLTKSAYPELI